MIAINSALIAFDLASLESILFFDGFFFYLMGLKLFGIRNYFMEENIPKRFDVTAKFPILAIPVFFSFVASLILGFANSIVGDDSIRAVAGSLFLFSLLMGIQLPYISRSIEINKKSGGIEPAKFLTKSMVLNLPLPVAYTTAFLPFFLHGIFMVDLSGAPVYYIASLLGLISLVVGRAGRREH